MSEFLLIFLVKYHIFLTNIFFFKQINGVDIRDASHDDAVQLLKESPRFVRLIVERELRGPILPPPSPRSPSQIKGLSPSGYSANRPSNIPIFVSQDSFLIEKLFINIRLYGVQTITW